MGTFCAKNDFLGRQFKLEYQVFDPCVVSSMTKVPTNWTFVQHLNLPFARKIFINFQVIWHDTRLFYCTFRPWINYIN
jgi:hypothetical protein